MGKVSATIQIMTNMTGIGSMIREKAKEFIDLLMEKYSKETGRIIQGMVKELYFLSTATHIKAHGWQINNADKEFISLKAEKSIQGNGKTTSITDMES